MDHVGEMALCDLNGKRLDLAGPQGGDPAADCRQGEAADAVEQAPQGQTAHFAAACTMVRVVLTAAWAV